MILKVLIHDTLRTVQEMWHALEEFEGNDHILYTQDLPNTKLAQDPGAPQPQVGISNRYKK